MKWIVARMSPKSRKKGSASFIGNESYASLVFQESLSQTMELNSIALIWLIFAMV